MKTLLSLLLLTLALTFPAAAQQKTPPSPGADRPLNLPKITEKKLANGLTVIMAPLPNVPKVTAILTFRSATTGADRQNHPGIAAITSTVATEGTDTRTSKQIKEELRSIGGALGLGANADATSMTTSALSEFSSRLFDLMNDVVQHPGFPETELKLAKENTIQQIRAGRADPSFLVNERFQKAVFGDHPYSFVVPDEKSINALTRDDLRGRYDLRQLVLLAADEEHPRIKGLHLFAVQLFEHASAGGVVSDRRVRAQRSHRTDVARDVLRTRSHARRSRH